MGNPVVPPLPGQPPGFVNVGDVATQEVDPKAFGTLFGQGQAASGWIERLVIAFWLAFAKALQAVISLIASGLDQLIALLGQFFLAAQGNNTPGFYNLTADLITDLTGVEVNGAALFDRYQKRGRIAAMQATGGAFVDLLASEFAGVTQTEAGGVFNVGKGSGIGGLPAVAISPESGMNAARAFLGFAMSFAVREGNTDFFASLIPFGIGEGYKSFAEDLSKSLGLGRLTRLALKPLFQNLVAIPMTWAFNKQYTPTLLGANEAVRAFNNGLFTGDQLNEELARHGYSTERRNALQAFHTKYPPEADLFLLELAGQISSDDHRITLRRIGYDDDNITKLIAAETLHEKRHLSLQLAQQLIHPLLTGTIDLPTYTGVLDRFTLTAEEKTDFAGYATELLSHPRKRLTWAQLAAAFVAGVATVDDIATYLHDEGYRQDDIAILLQLDLFKLKAAQAKTAAAKAKAAAAAAKAAAKTPTTPTTPAVP
jgi:hypothetical protein